jgi:hypothetical protein
MRRLRGETNAPPTLGRRRAPPGGTRTPRQELADGVRKRYARAEKRGPSAVKRRDGAPQGAASPRKERCALNSMTRRPARHSLACCEGREKDGGRPGAGKEYGRRSVGCLTGESVNA